MKSEIETLKEQVEYYKEKSFQLEQMFEAQRDTIDKYHQIFMLQEAELKKLRCDTLVRCKDCKWNESAGLPCPLDMTESLGDDGFCSCGERRG